MANQSPSATAYLLSAPTVLATISRYLVHGSPHPALSLRDLIQAALFKHFAGQSLLPPNPQSSWSARMSTTFSPSVTCRPEVLAPFDDDDEEEDGEGRVYYGPELTHPSVPITSVPAFWLTPKARVTAGVVILYFRRRGVLTIDYRLGHTAPFPAAVQDCVTAYWTLRHVHGYAASQVVLVGESAGAGLCLATLLHLRDRHETPRSAVLLSPLVQTRDTTAPSFASFEAVDFISAGGLRDVVREYVALVPDSRFIQLFDNSFVGLPPLFVSYGDAEVLADDDRALCVRARADGVDVVEDVGVGRVHVWIALPHHQQQARPVWQRIKRFIDGPAARL
ncbi:Arylesterase/monoxygenase [Taphrina deformans PYCC 5710]|uniref:Arylesterase/monoxygenase n=1 Tax=Taphrina deformans (strain PYCC 5710 / ATCC 11124 / CBS 356.35 / IMI 108563 / JCM 9778 / NBRC 8474) TaxID=1097556 RepID=R4X879_TAPDE|nr:Arylesterase/monoxygenase [Taphrina deformans PYCC 5710]|eukprot:CCG81744.1 Arylesterase/monoxygenase [Taphrina deformans PYCC 5710]